MTTWLLAALLAVVAGVGDGLHLIPGNGHAVRLPGGLIYLGVEEPQRAPSSVDGSPAAGCPHHRSLLILDEDDCAICSICAQSLSSTGAVDFVLVLPIEQHWQEITSCDFHVRVAASFDARAPPLA